MMESSFLVQKKAAPVHQNYLHPPPPFGISETSILCELLYNIPQKAYFVVKILNVFEDGHH